MSIELQIKSEVLEVERMLGNVSRQVIDPALRQAANDSAKKTKTAAGRSIKTIMGLRRLKPVSRSLRAVTARPGQVPSAAVVATGAPIPLSEFVGTRATRKGVKAKPMGRAVFIQSGFRQTVGARNSFWRRKGKRRLPIRELTGPPVPSVMVKQVVNKKMNEVALTTFRDRFAGHVARRLRRI